MSNFRNDRERCKRYCYGKQWDDLIEVDGRKMREEDYIRSQGNVPLKNNLIRRLVRSVLGVFRNRYDFPSAESLDLDDDNVIYERLRKNARRNRLDELHARTMEEFLISGMAIHRKSLSAFTGGGGGIPSMECLTTYVAPDTFFIDCTTRDFRGWDARLIGQLHDLDFQSLCAAFARGRSDIVRLREIYGHTPGSYSAGIATGTDVPAKAKDFFSAASEGLCRVVEIWTRESVERYRIHDRREGRLYRIDASEYDEFCERHRSGIESGLITMQWIADETWSYHYLSPSGDVLAEGVSPIAGGGQPYVWKAYPFIDGEIHSFVADIIDQQRHTNRLITLYDWVIRSSAKGVLLFPESALPDDVEIDDISDEWSRFNGVILFRPKAGMPLPQQVSGGASQAGITDLLNIQLKMLEDVSGVNGALEGKLTNSNVSGSLFNQQTRQAMTALLDILESYDAFVLEGARLDLRLITS